jgi:hypothetical protein
LNSQNTCRNQSCVPVQSQVQAVGIEVGKTYKKAFFE